MSYFVFLFALLVRLTYQVCLILTLQWPHLCRLQCFGGVFFVCLFFGQYFLPMLLYSVKSSLLLSAGIVPSLTESGVKNSSRSIPVFWGKSFDISVGVMPFRFVKFTANPRTALLDPKKSKISKHAYKNIMHFNTLYRKHIVFVNIYITIIVNIQLLCNNMVWTSAWHFL